MWSWVRLIILCTALYWAVRSIKMTVKEQVEAAEARLRTSITNATGRVTKGIQDLKDQIQKMIDDEANDLTQADAAPLLAGLDDLSTQVDAIVPDAPAQP